MRAVAQWEHPRGTRPTRENLIRVAEIVGVSFEWLATGNPDSLRSKAALGSAAEIPGVMLEAFAHTVQEETLLYAFRNLPAHRRALLISVAEAFAPPPRTPSMKRR